MKSTERKLAIIVVFAASAMLAACRPEDANRQTEFTPGVYKGEAMPTLTKQQVEDLQKRGMLLR
jgi:major membrane immunogen (membrane-anchored lipoprotein)